MSEKHSNNEVKSTHPNASPPAAPLELLPPKTWKVGNLVYTKVGLVTLFFWLFWGDFCFVLMEQAFQPILQVKLLKGLGCDPEIFSMIMTTLPAVLNFFMNPVISIRSDRHRGPRGRRIPFLLYSTPFVCAFLALMGFGSEIGSYLHGHFFSGLSLAGVTIFTFAVLFLVFTVFNMFLNTTFYYLFNDVVPREHLVKFMGYMRIIGTLAGMVYQKFLFGYTNKSGPFSLNLGFFQWHTDEIWYPKLILIGIAIFYLVGFTMACLRIKEPSYPPPPPLAEGQKVINRFVSTFKTLGTECFTHKFYWIYFITVTVDFTATVLANFQTSMLVDVNVDLQALGDISAYTAPVSLILIFLTANFGDRWRPMPMMVVSMFLIVLTAPVGLLFLIPGLSPNTYLGIRVAYMLTHLPVNVILGLAAGPLAMTLLPKERYGQFAAATAMIRTLLAQVVGVTIGSLFLKLMKYVHGGGDYYMRYCYVWQTFFQIAALICYYTLFREWKKLGGVQSYKPPAVGKIPTTG